MAVLQRTLRPAGDQVCRRPRRSPQWSSFSPLGCSRSWASRPPRMRRQLRTPFRQAVRDRTPPRARHRRVRRPLHRRQLRSGTPPQGPCDQRPRPRPPVPPPRPRGPPPRHGRLGRRRRRRESPCRVGARRRMSPNGPTAPSGQPRANGAPAPHASAKPARGRAARPGRCSAGRPMSSRGRVPARPRCDS
jgi:hypothetical protein